jgi:hypothetical protein
MTTRRRLSAHAAPAALAGALAGVLLSACGPSGGAASTASALSTTSTPPPATVTVTTTVTARPTATRPVPTTPVRPTIDPSPTTPPPGKDAPAVPRSAQDYGIAFVTAWVEGDRARLTQLGTESAVKAASATRVDTAPRFERCEGAAGSSYCTWAGDGYTLQLRILNETASRGQLHAVTEVVFRH